MFIKSSLISKKSITFNFISIVICRFSFLKTPIISFLSLSCCGPEYLFTKANPSSRYSPTDPFIKRGSNLLSKKRPTNSHTSAPSKDPSATSNWPLLSFFTQGSPLKNKKDFLVFIIASTISSVIVQYCFANSIDLDNKSRVMDG